MNKAGFTTHTLVPGIFLAELEFMDKMLILHVLSMKSYVFMDEVL